MSQAGPQKTEGQDATAGRFTLDPGARALMADLDLSVGNVLRRAGLPGDLFAHTPVSLSTPDYYRFWEALEQEWGGSDLPTAISRALSADVFSPPIFAALCSPDLNVAANRLAKYKRLVGPLRLSVVSSDDEITLECEWPQEPPVSLAMTELLFWVGPGRIGTRTAIRPVRIGTPEPPVDREAYREYLGIEVDRTHVHTVAFAGEDATRPFLTADERMWDFFEPELGRRLSELEAGSSTEERVRAALLELLPAGDATTGAVARELAVSTRTLQRQLSAEGTTFQALLNETREALARRYLHNPEMTAGEISFLLGYTDPNSFYRAFHAWTGQTPERVRAGAA